VKPALNECEVPIGRPVALQAVLIALLCVVLANEKIFVEEFLNFVAWSETCFAARTGRESIPWLCETIEHLGSWWFFDFLTITTDSTGADLKSLHVKLRSSDMRRAAQ
jgi:hypothetical protein